MYDLLTNTFLASEVVAIRMEAIKTISFILQSDVDLNQFDQLGAARQSKKKIFNKILAQQKIEYASQAEMEVDDDDTRANEIAAYFQLFSSLFCSNFLFRKQIIFEMSKLVLRYQVPAEMASKIFAKILTFLKCNADSLMDTNSLVFLIMKWLQAAYKLDKQALHS